jgi:hypothetical protein
VKRIRPPQPPLVRERARQKALQAQPQPKQVPPAHYQAAARSRRAQGTRPQLILRARRAWTSKSALQNLSYFHPVTLRTRHPGPG